MRQLLRIALALPFLALGSCARNISPPGVFFSSEPPGARILVDGQDSGYVTPRMSRLNDLRSLLNWRLSSPLLKMRPFWLCSKGLHAAALKGIP